MAHEPDPKGYDYRILEVVNVVDGDTVDVVIDVGFHITATVRLRLAVVDAAERYGRYATAKGLEATSFTSAWLQGHESLRVATAEEGSFGRWLAAVYCDDTGELLGDSLVAAGLAEPE